MQKKKKYMKNIESINSMTETIFNNNDLTINKNGVFIKPIYKNISYYEMKRIELVRGHFIKRWKFSFTMGAVIMIFFSIMIINSTPNIDITTSTNVQALLKTYISLFIFLSFGLYLLFLSLLKKPCIKIFTLDNHMYLYPLSNNRNQLSNVVSFLKTCNVVFVNMLPPIDGI